MLFRSVGKIRFRQELEKQFISILAYITNRCQIPLSFSSRRFEAIYSLFRGQWQTQITVKNPHDLYDFLLRFNLGN